MSVSSHIHQERISDNPDLAYVSRLWFGLALRYMPVVAREACPSWSCRSPTGTPLSKLHTVKLCRSIWGWMRNLRPLWPAWTIFRNPARTAMLSKIRFTEQWTSMYSCNQGKSSPGYGLQDVSSIYLQHVAWEHVLGNLNRQFNCSNPFLTGIEWFSTLVEWISSGL